MHAQRFVKVNAPVDEGIIDLVSALSSFSNLQTTSSCEGSANHPARVCFIYGNYCGEDHWRDLAEFVLGFFGPRLTREVGDRATIDLHICESGLIQAELTVFPGCLPTVVKAIRKIRRFFSTWEAHKCAYCSGTQDTSRSNC